MKLIILENDNLVGEWAANYIASAIARHSSTNNSKKFFLGLPTGSTPVKTYRRLVELFENGSISFSNVTTFNMDEYAGLSREDNTSFYHFMAEHLFTKVDLAQEDIHFLSTIGIAPADWEDMCAQYSAAIASNGGLDLQIAGTGVNGHIAFNEPYSSFYSTTRVVKLTKSTRMANSEWFGGDAGAVPEYALTIGIGEILSSKDLLVIATGSAKSRAVRLGVEGPLTSSLPLSAIQLHPKSTLVCDRLAASLLSQDTIEYFMH